MNLNSLQQYFPFDHTKTGYICQKIYFIQWKQYTNTTKSIPKVQIKIGMRETHAYDTENQTRWPGRVIISCIITDMRVDNQVYKIVENRIRKDNYLATIVEYSDQVFLG